MNLTYNILENGYQILNDGKVWIEQIEPFIPDKSKSYEENAKAQIAELLQQQENAKKEQTTLEELQQQVTDLQLAVVELAENGGNV